MNEGSNEASAQDTSPSDAALHELEALAAEWVERQRQRLKTASH